MTPTMTQLSSSPHPFRVRTGDGKDMPVSDRHAEEARAIDTNGDGFCDDGEIAAYMRAQQIIRAEGLKHTDVGELVNDYKYYLRDQPLPQAVSYHTYEQAVADMQQMASSRPDLVQMSSLGKTHEGRDIWALKISQNAAGDTSNKPGVVFTGLHHAREWISMETPLALAHNLVDGYDRNAATKQRVDNAEIWVIPIVNPDGYEYSRMHDSMWRKNRSPITESACPGQEPKRQQFGVDPNRNYYDGNPDHMFLYRPAGDTPCSTWDDNGASDRASAEDFRGARPASEPEVQALQQLEYKRPNIKGIIDHHSYGEELLRPWGYTMDDPADVKEYDALAAQMQAAQQAAGGTVYNYHAACADYPTSGSSESTHQINGIKNFTIEMGTSFHPSAKHIPEISKTVVAADLAFLDWVVAKNPATPAPVPAPAA
jgi:murein tripeptide amidase MpaA